MTVEVLTVYGTGWGDGEVVEVNVVAGDGSSVALGSETANAGGAFTIDASGTGLPVGGYSVVATGDQGGLASGLLLIKL